MSLSVKGKLQTLCAVIVAGFALVVVVDILEARHTERTLALERLTVVARIEALEMRRQEKNFFLRHDPEALAAVRRHQQAAVAAIEAIRASDPDHDPLSDVALSRLEAYRQGFEAIAGSPGGADAVDPTARYLESSQALEHLSDSQPDLASAVARVARLEKRWLASGTSENLQRLTREAERLRDVGGLAGPPPGDAARVANAYVNALGDYASRLEDAGSASAGFVSAARALEPVTEALRASYEARRNAIEQVTNLLDMGIQAAVLVLVALAAWGLFQAVATPLERLRRHARRLVRGEATDLDPTEYSGEFRDLATDIAAMEGHLLATIRELAAKEREAADQAAKAEAARQQAEELGRVKTDFLSLVSHEFKTPLTSMVGFAQVMRKRLERGPLAEAGRPLEVVAEVERLRHNLVIMLEEGRKLAGLIDNVLELAALDSGDLPLALEPLSAAELLDRAAAPHLAAMAAKRLDFVRDIPDDLPPLRGDRGRLVFVFDQLLSNAVKFTRTGHVACRAEVRDGRLVLAVEDTGQGIPADMGEAVFEKFFQIGDVTTGKIPGLGIGLAAAKAVVERHGGSITAHGLPGQGARVEVALPLYEATP